MRLKKAIKLYYQNIQESLDNDKPFEFIKCKCKPTQCPYECVEGIKWGNFKFEDNRLTVPNGHVFKLDMRTENLMHYQIYLLENKESLKAEELFVINSLTVM